MNTVSRGVRNAFRNSIRTFSIVMILGLSIGLTLAMTVARASVQVKIDDVKSSVGNTITITPAGSRDFMGGGEPLTTEQLSTISGIDSVIAVKATLTDRLTSEYTNLVSAVEAGSLGQRGATNSGVGFATPPPEGGILHGDSSTQATRTFTPPVMVTGTNSLESASSYGGDTVTITSGEVLDPTQDTNTAMVGASLATKNSLTAGSTFTMYDATITVAGVYDTGNVFANNAVIMPLGTLQRISGQEGSVTMAVVTVDSIDDIASTTSALEESLGESADVVSNQDNVDQIVEPLQSVKTIATYSVIGAVIAGAVIILLTMIMIVRERRREIGVLKAIGAPNTKVMTQFISEAVTLTVLGMVVGVIIGIAAANPLTQALVTNSTANTESSTSQPAVPGQGGRMNVVRTMGGGAVASAKDVQASVGWEVLGYGVIVALLIAIIGSAFPAYIISKVNPAEVMRAE